MHVLLKNWTWQDRVGDDTIMLIPTTEELFY